MKRVEPQACKTMAELRVQIDALDRDLVKLLAERAGYIDRAIVLKPGERLPARIEDRVSEVMGNARREAAGRGLDTALVDALWQTLIEWSIERETAVLGELKKR